MAEQGGVVWVQDYQLQLVPQMLRSLRPDRDRYFLHIPFPPTDCSSSCRGATDLGGLLGADLVGFQLPGGAQNFVRLVRRDSTTDRRDRIRTPDGRNVLARSYPIPSTEGTAQHGHVGGNQGRGKQIRRDLGDPRVIFLGVDRLDYTKGMPERIRAFGELGVEGSIDMRRRCSSGGDPSRERVDQYRRLRDDLDRLGGRLNGEIGRLGTAADHNLHTSYRARRWRPVHARPTVMVVTPLRDGRTSCQGGRPCRDGDTGALVLSEFAAPEGTAAGIPGEPARLNGLKQALLLAMNDSDRNKAAGCGSCVATSSSTISTGGRRSFSATSVEWGTGPMGP